MTEHLNPYIAGAPVTDARMFFGREDVFEWIEHSLTGQYADHILVIHGQRRVGKTSVLRQLPARLPPRYIPVFFDFQGRTHTSLDRFLWWLSREIVRVLKQDHALLIPLPEKEAFTRDPDYLESQFLPGLRPLLGDHVLLLTFDEFDCLEEAEIRDTLGRPLVDYLRRLMGQPGLNFIFSIGSSGRKLENMQASYTEFFKAALYKKVSFLQRGDAQSLIANPVRGVLEYEAAAVDEIFRITSGHPYFTQLICHELFARCQKDEARRVRRQDVLAVLDDVVERGTVNLKFVWDEASDLEKWCLAGLAHLEGDVDIGSLGEFLGRQRVRFGNPDLESSLVHLREKDVLTSDNRYVIDLLRLWLKENRPIEQVREELTEVNPIANRYIEIGLEYKDSRQFERAIESFQQALEIDPDNLQALVGVAQVHLDQKAYAQAVAGFENALAVDDEDVPARSGLCEAHLALGDLASAKGKAREAIQSYERVLAINTDHTEARQRMADIYRQQAEKALVDRRDEEALSAFRQALGYTPEDESLEARVIEVQAQKRASVLAALRERVDLALRQQRWEQATGALEEALALEPGDPDLLGKLGEARSGLRKSQQAAAQARASSSEKAERWDDAVQAWGEYLALEPPDRAAAQGEIARVEKARSVAQSYSQARTALTKKDYGSAVSLLKAIVVEDEAYKDASRLMAEAIELRRARRRFWRSRWLRAGIAGAILVSVAGLGWWAWPRVTAGLSSSVAPTDPAIVQETAVTTQADRTASSVAAPTSPPTPTSIPLIWARLSSGQFLPRDRVTSIVIDPEDPGLLYVGTENAGVYKSIDGGLSWQPAHSGMERASVQTLVIDPGNPAILYAGTLMNGVYKTEDRAETWRAVNRGIELPGWNWTGVLAMDKLNSQHLYYAHGLGIYETEDGGESWHDPSRDSCPSMPVDLVVHPADGKTLFVQSIGDSAAGCQGGVYVSRDGGQTWDLSQATDASGNAAALAIDGANGTHLYAASDNGLYGSDDGGATWSLVLHHPCSAITFAPNNDQVTYCGFDQALEETRDGGTTWRRLRDGGLTAIAIPLHDPQSLWVGGEGLVLSGDSGESWTERGSGLGAGHVELGIDPVDNLTLYLQTSSGWLYRSTDEGRNWMVIEDQGSGLSFGAPTNALYRAAGERILVSQDNGNTWDSLQAPTNLMFVGTNPRRPETLYAMGQQCGAQGSIYTSTDSGRTWSENVVNVPCDRTRAFVGSGEGQRVYLIGDTELVRSDDGGETWQYCAISYAARYGSRLTLDPRDDDHLYLPTRFDGVMVSEDGCESWQPSNNGLGSLFVNTVAIDPGNPDTLYAGTDGGAYVSFDGGASWGEINEGLLGATVVYSIVVDSQSNVYAATPYGIFKLEGG